MESQPQNPEFRNNPEKCHPSMHMRFWYFSHCQAKKDQASLHKRADLPEPSLLAYANYRCT